MLHLNPTLKVTRHAQAYGLFELVVDLGSSLSLWLGLSMIGVVDDAREAVLSLYQRLRKA